MFQTDDGMVIAGEPDSAATWFPVNDHPLDKASYTFKVTVPAGLAGSRQRLPAAHEDQARPDDVRSGMEKDPMASYLATVDVGKFEISAYSQDGMRFYDAIDPDAARAGRGAARRART